MARRAGPEVCAGTGRCKLSKAALSCLRVKLCSTWGPPCRLGRLQSLHTQHRCSRLPCVPTGALDLGPARQVRRPSDLAYPVSLHLAVLHVNRHARAGSAMPERAQAPALPDPPLLYQAARSIEVRDLSRRCLSCPTNHKRIRLHAVSGCKIAVSAAIAAAEPEGNCSCYPASPTSVNSCTRLSSSHLARSWRADLSPCAAASDLEGRQLRRATSCNQAKTCACSGYPIWV